MNLEEVICPLCFKYFDDQDNTPHMLPACGHTFCSSCIKNIIEKLPANESFVCPEDGIAWNIEKKGIDAFPKNCILVNLFDRKRTLSNYSSKQKSSVSSSIFDTSSINISPSKLDIISYNSGPNASFNQIPDDICLNVNTACKEHFRKLEIICIDHKCRICSKCALFGSHKNHNIRTEEDVLKEISIRTEVIWEMYKIIEQNQNKISNQEYIDKLKLQIKTKHDEIIQEAHEKFEEYITLIKDREKKFIEETNQKFHKLEKTLLNLKELPSEIADQLKTWKSSVLNMLEILNEKKERNDIAFELLEDRHNPHGDVVSKGEKLLEEMERAMKIPPKYLDENLKAITVVFNNSFKNLIENSCTLVSNISPGFDFDWNKVINQESLTSHGINNQGQYCYYVNKESSQNKKFEEDLLNCNNSELSLVEIPEPVFTDSRESSPKHSLSKTPQPLRKSYEKLPKVKESSFKGYDNNNMISASSLLNKFLSPVDTLASRENLLRRSMSPHIQVSSNSFRADHSPNDINTPNNTKSNKKKKPNFTIPFKFIPTIEALKNGATESIDLTGAELGDTGVAYISALLVKSRGIKSLKLVKNKITDEGLHYLIKALSTNTSITTLNLTQNQLSDRSLDLLISLPETNQAIKKVYLSQNLINTRNAKNKIKDMHELGIEVYL